MLIKNQKYANNHRILRKIFSSLKISYHFNNNLNNKVKLHTASRVGDYIGNYPRWRGNINNIGLYTLGVYAKRHW